MPIGIGAAIIGGSLISGLASNAAADKQAGAAAMSNEEARRQYDLSRADLQPWREAGKLSLGRLMELMGIGAPAAAPTRAQFTTTTPGTPGRSYQPMAGITGVTTPGTPGTTTFDQAGYDKAVSNTPVPSDYGSLLKEFTGQDLQNEPGYQFGLSQGEQGINRAALARGGYDSGTTLKSLLKFNQDYAGTKFDQAFNRNQINKNQTYNMLAGVSGVGQNTASQLANINQNFAGQYGQNTQAAGDARAAGLVGVGNAITGGLGQFVNYRQNQSLLDMLKSPSSAYGVTGV